MGSSESSLLNPSRDANEITTVSHRTEAIDPLLQKLKAIKITTPILTSTPGETSLTDILVNKSSSSSTKSVVSPNVLLEIFTVYRDWQQKRTREISKRQEEIENKIEVADALSVKLLQRFNYSVSSMRTSSQQLSEVHGLQVELGELKGRLTEVISNCDALCKRIAREGSTRSNRLQRPMDHPSSYCAVADSKLLLRFDTWEFYSSLFSSQVSCDCFLYSLNE